jgi:hypothetical protein
MPDGYGILHAPEGGKIEGNFEPDSRGEGGGISGNGYEYWPDGSYYIGAYDRGVKHGYGTLKLANGDEYTGEFKNNFIQGRGAYKYSNGDRFEGSFLNNRREGPGTLFKNDGSEIKAKWVNDLKQGEGTIIDAMNENLA